MSPINSWCVVQEYCIWARTATRLRFSGGDWLVGRRFPRNAPEGGQDAVSGAARNRHVYCDIFNIRTTRSA